MEHMDSKKIADIFKNLEDKGTLNSFSFPKSSNEDNKKGWFKTSWLTPTFLGYLIFQTTKKIIGPILKLSTGLY